MKALPKRTFVSISSTTKIHNIKIKRITGKVARNLTVFYSSDLIRESLKNNGGQHIIVSSLSQRGAVGEKYVRYIRIEFATYI